MLSKLLKKDLQATARTFLPLILGFVLISILAKISFEVIYMSAHQTTSANTVLSILVTLVIVLYVLYAFACFIMTYIFIVSDFYKTMVSNQGYLTHTLPVKTSTILNSKLIIAFLWQIIIFVLVTLSILLFFVGHIDSSFQYAIIDFNNSVGIDIGQFLGFITACMVIGAISSPLMFYASIAIGHLFGSHKVLGAILAYFVIYTIIQIISVIVLVALGWSSLYVPTPTDPLLFRSIMWFTIIFSFIISIIFYIVTNYVLSKKLNLE